MSQEITPILLPKWGMDMDEGKIGEWLVSEGGQVNVGAEILEIESEKVTNVLEATASGVLRRMLVNIGEVHPVGTLLGIVAGADVSDDELSDFIAGYRTDPDDAQALELPTLQQTDDVTEVAGQRLHYTVVGQGEPAVLLVHGFGGNLSSWGALPAALAASFRVISVDLPGHGSSTKQVAEVGSQDLAQLLIAFLDQMEVGDVHLIGHSLGGTIVTQLASLASSRVRSLTLISNYGTGTKVDIDYIETFVAASRRKDVKIVLKQLFLDSTLVTSEMTEGLLMLKRLDGADLALRAIADMIKAEQPSTGVITLPPVPTQIIIGREDKIIMADDALLAGLENLSIVDDAGHMPQLEKATLTTGLIEGFLKTIGKDGSEPQEHGL